MINPDVLLNEMAATFAERGKTYGDNWLRIGGVLKALFPSGITLLNEHDHMRFNLFSLMLVKMTRLAVADLAHEDSAHDIGVYAAMLEAVIKDQQEMRKDEFTITAEWGESTK